MLAARSPGDALLAAGIAAFAATVPLLLRLPLDRLEWILVRRDRSSRQAPLHALLRRLDLIDVTLAAFRPVVRAGCLVRGVSACYFLGRLSRGVRLQFGIRETAAGCTGHCWIEVLGEPIGEPEDPRRMYRRTHAIPAAGIA